MHYGFSFFDNRSVNFPAWLIKSEPKPAIRSYQVVAISVLTRNALSVTKKDVNLFRKITDIMLFPPSGACELIPQLEATQI